MGLRLLDDKNKEHAFGGDYTNNHLMDILVGVPALLLEPFVVVGGISQEFFPPSEVCPHKYPLDICRIPRFCFRALLSGTIPPEWRRKSPIAMMCHWWYMVMVEMSPYES